MKAALCLVIAAALTSTSLGDDPEWENPHRTQVAFLFEWIELDHREANKLIRKHATQVRAGALRKDLGEMVKKAKAQIVQTAYLITKSGQRAKTQAIDYHVYPTEYDPPELLMEIDKNTRPGELIITPANPTSFDSRSIGTTVEIEPVISKDGKFVELNLAPEIVTRLADRGVSPNDAQQVPKPLAPIKHPAIYVMKLHTQLTLAAGDFTLAGVFTPPGKSDKRVMLMIHTKIRN